MPKQKRRTISLNALSYQRLQDYCADNDMSVSGWLERLIAEQLDREGIPMPTMLRPRTPREHHLVDEAIAAQYFTF